MSSEKAFASGSVMPVAAQLALMMLGLAAIVLAPPVRGAMLLVPLTDQARDHLAALAIEHGALLLGRGLIEGSLIVRADRADIALALLRRGIVPIAASDMMCGSAVKNGNEA